MQGDAGEMQAEAREEGRVLEQHPRGAAEGEARELAAPRLVRLAQRAPAREGGRAVREGEGRWGKAREGEGRRGEAGAAITIQHQSF